jgi:hypothetical protein
MFNTNYKETVQAIAELMLESVYLHNDAFGETSDK